jgi:sialate O-acetylesterase
MSKSILSTAVLALLTTCVQAADMASLVPESKDFQTVYELVPSKSATYTVDNSAKISGQIERIAYFMLLNDKDYVFVAMDPFTTDIKKIGVPSAQSGALFQTLLKNLLVKSNVEGVKNGSFAEGGNVEFWPSNYGGTNVAKVPNATGAFDFGDGGAGTGAGYGSMQVHNYSAKQTLFAYNNFRAGAKADLGIGNRSTGNPDWTFAKNASTYTAAKLVVLVKTK